MKSLHHNKCDIKNLETEPRCNSHAPSLPALRLRFHVVLCIHISHEIHIGGTHEFSLLEQFPGEDHGEKYGELEVEADEIDGGEARAKGGPALDEHDEGVEDDADGGTPWIHPVAEGEKVFFVLGFEACAETE